jgi:serine/threonine protein kinase/formylglycine-generating enzyme required for sulfatase activity
MAPDSPINEAIEVDRICDAFESQHRAGRSPLIEDFLEQIPATSRDKLLEALLHIDLELSEQPLSNRLPDYLRRFSSDVVLRFVNHLGPLKSEPTLNLSDFNASGNTATDGQHKPSQSSDNNASDIHTTDRTLQSDGSLASREDASTSGDDSSSPAKVPERIGRYEILKPLGEGGFGCVYLARDSVLDREVALKVIGTKLLHDPLQINNLVREARTVAQLEGHPGLVAVRDVQFEGDYPYIVQEYVKGLPLDDWGAQQMPTLRRSIELFARMVDAIGYAHQRDFVHRDLKPSNILIDADDQPHIVDFGLALNLSAASLKRGEVAGTPSYMAPEQVRGESHRIDGRTDIWSLGIILYKMLTGRLPFQGKKFSELQEKITKVDPRPPRQLVPNLPGELERICLRCLEKLSSNRYGSTIELQEDLSSWLGQSDNAAWSPNETQVIHANRSDSTQRNSDQGIDSQQGSSSTGSQPLAAIVPKGLRCFDEHDADFFLELLPGPRDRHGLPDRLRFWKQRLETNDSEQTFSVGLLYGPSGCGKSSLIRAGLIPRLSPEIDVIFVEATQDSTEERISRGLQARYPKIPAETLTEQLAWLRDRKVTGQRKTVIIIDQLEQWLHGREIDFSQPLVQALRQCNGSQVQCLLMIRDDFWMAATRLMRELEIRLVEGENSAAVDLFSIKHARRVLQSFGMAFQALPEPEQTLTPEQNQFLDKAVEGLSEEGNVVCVRLTLFAEMMKQRPWTSETLKQVGGVLGIGATFLEETFSSRNAPPEYRRHQQAARRLLQALLPQSSENIKGHMRTSKELMQVSGYESQPREFQRLVEILNEELRLITPTDPESQVAYSNSADEVPELAQRYYQLTHDYLVPSLRDWLTRKQRETRKGRTELRLAERTTLWNAQPENRFLPNLWEYLLIQRWTQRQEWTEPQRKLMKAATRYHAIRWGSGLAIVMVFAISIWLYLVAEQRRHRLNLLESAIGKVRSSRSILAPEAIQALRAYDSREVLQRLQHYYQTADPDEKPGLAYALAAQGTIDLDYLIQQIRIAPPSEAANLTDALKHDVPASLAALKKAALKCQPGTAQDQRRLPEEVEQWRYEARLAITAMAMGDASLAQAMCIASPDATRRTIFIDEAALWLHDLKTLAETVNSVDDSYLRYAMCLAVGQVSQEVKQQETAGTRIWEEQLTQWYQQSPYGNVHSAAYWALKAWKLTLPDIQTPLQVPDDQQWQIDRMGNTLIRIPPGKFTNKFKQTVIITQPFLIADRETTAEQFLRFINDPDYPNENKPQNWEATKVLHQEASSYPIGEVNWYDSLLYCNWLSHRDGLEPFYRWGPDQTENHQDQWVTVPEANGYRLPTRAQWEHACRLGVENDLHFGSEKVLDLFIKYSRYGREGITPIPTASRLPSHGGLFDLHGNYWEWCYDYTGRQQGETLADPMGPMGPNSARSKTYIGGGYHGSALHCTIDFWHGDAANRRFEAAGIRVIKPAPFSENRSAVP